MELRYRVTTDNVPHSCCNSHAVLDERPEDPFNVLMCECPDLSNAQRICDALNAYDQLTNETI